MALLTAFNVGWLRHHLPDELINESTPVPEAMQATIIQAFRVWLAHTGPEHWTVLGAAAAGRASAKATQDIRESPLADVLGDC